MIVALSEPAVVVQADPQSLYQAAVADRLAGRPEQAVPKLEQVLAARPDDVDARLNLGLAQLALGRLDAAEAAFREVTRRAPAYGDAWAGLARVQQRRGDLAAARTSAAEAARLAPTDPEVRALQASLVPEPAWRAEVSGAYSRLGAGLPDWTEARARLSRRLDGGWTVGGGVEVTERFDDTDVYLEARADRRLADGGFYMAVGGAPDADYRPELAVFGGVQRRLFGRLSGTLDASAARYGVGTIYGLHPGVVVDLPGDRVQLSARWINIRDENGEHRDGWATQARWQATGRIALRAGYAEAPESSEGVTVDVTAWNLGADIQLTDRIVLGLGLISEDRGAYRREEATAGLGWRF